MRDFIGLAGALDIEAALEGSREVEVHIPSFDPNHVWISANGRRVLSEEDEGVISLKTGEEEFTAEWTDEITAEAAEKLAEVISESEDYGVYYLNNMTFVLKRQALAAARSLSRHP